MTNLPVELEALKNLKNLDLSHNENLNPTQILSIVLQLPNLNCLHLTGIPISEADQDAFKRSLPRCEITF